MFLRRMALVLALSCGFAALAEAKKTPIPDAVRKSSIPRAKTKKVKSKSKKLKTPKWAKKKYGQAYKARTPKVPKHH
jgi:hypothetical protein